MAEAKKKNKNSTDSATDQDLILVATALPTKDDSSAPAPSHQDADLADLTKWRHVYCDKKTGEWRCSACKGTMFRRGYKRSSDGWFVPDPLKYDPGTCTC